MDDALPILEYLPVSFKNETEGEYITFLWETFVSNYQSGKYQFALLAYHMLYMSYVYFSVWQIKQSHPADFANAVIFQKNEKELLSATSPFTFSEMQERSIFKFLRLAGCEQQHIGKFQKLVDERNDIAHSNGHIFFTDQTAADRKISEILEQIEAIQIHMTPVIHDCLRRFLLESWNPDEREYQDPIDQIREILIHTNYLSQSDIESALLFDITTLQAEKEYAQIKEFFASFKQEYKQD